MFQRHAQPQRSIDDTITQYSDDRACSNLQAGSQPMQTHERMIYPPHKLKRDVHAVSPL